MARTQRKRKPRISIQLTGSEQYPVIFHVQYPDCHWKNSQWHTWDEALIALGLKRR